MPSVSTLKELRTKVCFFFDDVSVSLKNRTCLKSFVETMFKNERKKLQSLNYIFCSDKKLLKINKQYLSHDFYTDIVTFDLSGKKDPIAGEIYISIDRVRDNAKEEQVAIKTELHRVIFHGVLHLCGYKDKTKAEQRKMRKREDFYLDKYFNYYCST